MLLTVAYVAMVNLVLWNFSEEIAMLFVNASETEVLADTALFLHVSASFFIFLGMVCIFRYTIQGAGYTQLSMLSGVAEMIARVLVSVVAVPMWGYWAVCFGDPVAWMFAVAHIVEKEKVLHTA